MNIYYWYIPIKYIILSYYLKAYFLYTYSLHVNIDNKTIPRNSSVSINLDFIEGDINLVMIYILILLQITVGLSLFCH